MVTTTTHTTRTHVTEEAGDKACKKTDTAVSQWSRQKGREMCGWKREPLLLLLILLFFFQQCKAAESRSGKAKRSPLLNDRKNME